MSRTPKSAVTAIAAAAAASPEEAPAPAVLTLGETPIIAALVALVSAVTALASFPSTPVPESLVQNITKTRQAFLEAVNAPIEIPPFGGTTIDIKSDDSWIKGTFEGLEASLKARFEGLDAAIADLTARFENQTPPEPVDLQSIEDRLVAIEDQIAAFKASATSAEA